MKTIYSRLTTVNVIILCACFNSVWAGLSLPPGRWVDLSHDFSTETIYWPTAEGFSLSVDFIGITEKGYFYTSNSFRTSEHGGTHIDAPIHFAQDRTTVDQIPLERLIGQVALIDVAEKALKNPDYRVSIEDFMAWEAAHGEIFKGTIILINTGYHRFWPDRKKYIGTDKRGLEAIPELHFPGLHPEAARWLVQNRQIAAIGLDTPSIDYGQSELFQSHQILFKNNIPAFENVANLDQLPPTGALVIALPMKIKGGSGSPLRIIAFIPDHNHE